MLLSETVIIYPTIKSLSYEQKMYKCTFQIEMIKPYYASIIKRCGEFAPFIVNYTGSIFVVTEDFVCPGKIHIT